MEKETGIKTVPNGGVLYSTVCDGIGMRFQDCEGRLRVDLLTGR